MATKGRIEQQLAQTRAELAAVVEQANRQSAALSGAIAALEALLEPEAESQDAALEALLEPEAESQDAAESDGHDHI